jgi:hypothetical protein
LTVVVVVVVQWTGECKSASLLAATATAVPVAAALHSRALGTMAAGLLRVLRELVHAFGGGAV